MVSISPPCHHEVRTHSTAMEGGFSISIEPQGSVKEINIFHRDRTMLLGGCSSRQIEATAEIGVENWGTGGSFSPRTNNGEWSHVFLSF